MTLADKCFPKELKSTTPKNQHFALFPNESGPGVYQPHYQGHHVSPFVFL
ncbi:MAG: hypothetical protein ACLR70_04690 [Streptococcus thermophilus]